MLAVKNREKGTVMKEFENIRLVEITSLQEEGYQEELAMYNGLNENQLYHYYEPKIGLFIAESPKVIERAMRAGYEPVSCLVEKNHLNQEAEETIEKIAAFFQNAAVEDVASEEVTPADVLTPKEFHIYVCDHDLYASITGLAMTRGMISVMKRRELTSLAEILNAIPGDKTRVAILDDVENPTNVGAIFRSAAALNMDAVLLTSTCSDPLYRRASRVSMGTVFQIPWTFFKGYTPSKDYFAKEGQEKTYSYIDELHELGYKVCAMALREDTVTIDDPKLEAEEKLAIILGNEGVGLPDATLEQCDYTVKIPMAHGVDSLNVAAASAVAFYALTLGK